MKPLLIAHRGNLRGPSPPRENRPDYCWAATAFGFDVEVDVWSAVKRDSDPMTAGFHLGHDAPDYWVDQQFLEGPMAWCHAKNLEALTDLLQTPARTFFHQNDDYALTTCGHIWTFPGKPLTTSSVCVLPERDPNFDLKNPAAYFQTLPYAICSDYVGDIRENWRE